MFSFLTFIKSLICLAFFLKFSIGIDTITPNKSIRDGEVLVSSDQRFELGFFSLGKSNRYLGIWYKSIPTTVVWVANRENPITNSLGALNLSTNGTLFLVNQSDNVIWSASSSRVAQRPFAQLLNCGNFVLLDDATSNSENYLWQSFDYPTDTRLPDMKMGKDLKTGKERYLTSWKSSDDPSPGDFTYRIDYHAMPQLVIDKRSTRFYRTGPWNGLRFSGLPMYYPESLPPIVVFHEGEFYELYDPYNSSTNRRVMIDQSGTVFRYVLNEEDDEWKLTSRVPSDPCDFYGVCGANSICRDKNSPICECLTGFIPKSPQDWSLQNWGSGCLRRVPLSCFNDDGFFRVEGVKLPDLLKFNINRTMSLEECRAECMNNCSCIAYGKLNISERGTGCLIWFDDLIDVREFVTEDNPQVIYIKLATSELNSIHVTNLRRRLAVIIALSVIVGIIMFAVLICLVRRKKKKREVEWEELELPLFDFVTLVAATNNFVEANMIGAGGFGSVYKGILLEGQEIAVKRLSKTSSQGVQEFKNEVILIAKLQHRNLVRMLGYCIQGEERMLVYEYMPNKSLDSFIFDQNKSSLLNWQKRYDIAIGIARGLLYLHQDSRLTVIHRDLKASNILLDKDFKPKIADFGLARIIEADQSEVKTKRVIGTYGYMSPEYAIDGKFSTKSDIFSLGVLLLELVSGKRNKGFRHSDHHHNLLGHAWLLWKEGNAMELIDPCLNGQCVEPQVLRCIHVGLLCIQQLPNDRPPMSLIVFMLGNEDALLPEPKQPGFFIERETHYTDQLLSREELIEDADTITVLEAR